jgi:predicted HicB family RNase H-like nuclease
MDRDARTPPERTDVRTLRVTVPEDLKEAVVARAKPEGVSTSEYVIRVLKSELWGRPVVGPLEY